MSALYIQKSILIHKEAKDIFKLLFSKRLVENTKAILIETKF